MDPNETLRELRAILRSPRTLSRDEAHRVVLLFDLLDGWLTTGGYPPSDWVMCK